MEPATFVLPPDVDRCKEQYFSTQLEDVDRIELRTYVHARYRHKIVSFSVELFGRNPVTGMVEEFYSIDTKHGTVHYHRHHGSRRENGRILARIPVGGWEFVDEWYYRAVDLCLDNWEMTYTDWKGTF